MIRLLFHELLLKRTSFALPKSPGTTTRFTVTEIDERDRAKATVIFRNQNDEIVIEANLTGILPGEAEKIIMNDTL